MLRKMLCTTTILIVLFGSVVLAQENASLSTVVEFKKYLIPKEGIQYFSDSLGSSLMELRTDGYYQSQAYNNKDKGTWQQLEDGRVRLTSETRYRPIYSDDFSIMVMDKDSVVQIPAMRERLARLLAGNERNVFAIQEIVDASKYTSRDGKKSSAVSSFSVQKKFSRADITNFIAAIDAYLKDTEKNISYLMAYQYPQYGFFEDDFSSWEIPPILLEKIKGDGVKVPDGEGYIGQLNNLLKTKGLRDHFSKVQLSAEGEVLLAREDKLTEKELMRLNRLVLEAAYPKECPKGTLDRKIVFLFEGTDEFENLGGIRKKLDTGFAPQFAMRRVDKFRYDKFIRDEDEQARAFEKMDQQHQKELALTPTLSPAEARVYLFSQSLPEYFSRSGAHTQYLVFNPDGSYRETDSGHFGVGEMDKGTWAQSPNGGIKMVSSLRFHNVESGSLSIFISDQEDIARLSVLKEKITDFLGRNTQEIISATEIMGLMQYQTRIGDAISVIRINYPAKSTSRNNLKKLQAKIDAYLKDSEKSVFYCTPYTYRDAKFLIYENEFGELDDVKMSIDRKEWPFVFMGTDAKQFAEGSGKPQPFRFYPEMNKCVGQIQNSKEEQK